MKLHAYSKVARMCLRLPVAKRVNVWAANAKVAKRSVPQRKVGLTALMRGANAGERQDSSLGDASAGAHGSLRGSRFFALSQADPFNVYAAPGQRRTCGRQSAKESFGAMIGGRKNRATRRQIARVRFGTREHRREIGNSSSLMRPMAISDS